MVDKYYNREEAKETLLVFIKDMTEAWEDFLINKETVSALLEDSRDNETAESYKAMLAEIGISKEDADTMIAQYKEEVSHG